MTSYKVMFVDDEYMILEGLKRIIDWPALGFTVTATAKSGTEALAYLKKNEVDLLITDIRMPDMTGIELVRHAQQLQNFFAIILSGYQEFTFVKEGMQLGIRNYLVKPVNKTELQQSVQDTFQALEKRREIKKQKMFFKESGLLMWLNDELNETEYEGIMGQFSTATSPPYTPLVIEASSTLLQELAVYFQQIDQGLIVHGRGSDSQLIVIYSGSRQQCLVSLRQLQQQRIDQRWQVIIGETITEWENLYTSFEKIKQIKEIQEFYPDLLPKEQIMNVDQFSQEDKLSFLSFNKALTIGDVKTLQHELDQIFQNLLQLQAEPERVKYISFLLFTDIYRQSPSLTIENYEAFIEAIRRSDTILALRELLEQVLKMSKENKQKKRYSPIIEDIVQNIEDHYSDDLSLKSAAETHHLSVVYLGQIFKKETELSFNQYLNLVRIKNAQKQLLHSQQTINEIAENIGYNNTNYFSKMFKKLNGITPKEFREIYSENYDPLS